MIGFVVKENVAVFLCMLDIHLKSSAAQMSKQLEREKNNEPGTITPNQMSYKGRRESYSASSITSYQQQS